MKRVMVFVLVLWGVGARPRLGTAKTVYKLKIATLLPRGTSWMRNLTKFKNKIKKQTRGAVKIIFYPGGVAGDEKDVVRKMRMGVLDGALTTSVGMGLLVPQVRVLELPLLFKKYKVFQCVRRKIQPQLETKFAAKGYRLLGLVASGWVYPYSTVRVTTLAGLRRAKVWRWIDDPLVTRILKRLGLSSVPLGVVDVLPSLQTGIINFVYGMAQTTLALQWHTRLQYFIDMKVNMSVGGFVMKKSTFDRLPAHYQKTVLQEVKSLQRALNNSSVKVNKKALRFMLRHGMKRIRFNARTQKKLRGESLRLQRALIGRFYSRTLLNALVKARKKCLATQP
jgi:TRAP-type C4-dicarboxylate transport system substrate-binding protein